MYMCDFKQKSISENFFIIMEYLLFFGEILANKNLYLILYCERKQKLNNTKFSTKSFTNAGPLKYTLQRRTRFSQLF